MRAQRSGSACKSGTQKSTHDIKHQPHLSPMYDLTLGCAQVMGLKKLAPYREDGGLSRPNYQQLGQLRGKLHSKRHPASKAADTGPSADAPDWNADNDGAATEGAEVLAPHAQQLLFKADGIGSLLKQEPAGEASTDPSGQQGLKKAKRKKVRVADGVAEAGPSQLAVASAQLTVSHKVPAVAVRSGPASLDTSREARLQTYARPSVAGSRKGLGTSTTVKQGMGHTKGSIQASVVVGMRPAAIGAELSKAQKKNLQRKRKRAEKHGS